MNHPIQSILLLLMMNTVVYKSITQIQEKILSLSFHIHPIDLSINDSLLLISLILIAYNQTMKIKVYISG